MFCGEAGNPASFFCLRFRASGFSLDLLNQGVQEIRFRSGDMVDLTAVTVAAKRRAGIAGITLAGVSGGCPFQAVTAGC